MAADNDYSRFRDLSYDEFRVLAADDSLSPHEKVGFPDSYRADYEESIFRDIVTKLGGLDGRPRTVLDIGAGCSGLARRMIDLCRARGHSLLLADSPEMLDHLPDEPFIRKVPGFFPRDCAWLFDEYAGRIDAILTYSVVQYVFAEASLTVFLDRSLGLLADGGRMLVGDVPNASMRRRFFRSPAGIAFHRAFTGTDGLPPVEPEGLAPGVMDDATVLAVLARYRAAGFHAFVVPQEDGLPMANRREDILILKP
jgi:hypothetical protein